MSDRPRFTRKSRPRLDASERARQIAEIAGEAQAEPPEAFDLPHVEEAPAPDAEELEREAEEIWEPALDASEEDEQALEEVFGAETEEEEAASAEPAPVPDAEPNGPSVAAALAALARELQSQPPAEAEEPTPEPEPEPEAPSMPEPQPEPAQWPIPEPDPEPEPGAAPAGDAPAPSPDLTWAHLASIPVDPGHLERNLIITAGRHDPAHGAFDVLRTRLVQTLHDNDWKRVAVTSPTRDCGKTFTAVNLAISLSRYEAMRTVLMDMDMRNPSVASVLGAANPSSMGDFLQGTLSVQDHFVRLGRNALNIGANLAVGLNDRIEPYAAELIQDPLSDAAFARMMAALDPDVVLYDLPPALAYDDVIAFRKHFDGILMVVGGGTTKADEVHEAMRRLGEDVPLLGVVLNQAENETGKGYTYGY